MGVILRPVGRDDVNRLIGLDPGIAGLVAPNAVTLAQAAYEEGAYVFCIEADGEIVGLMALADTREDGHLEPDDDPNCAYLWRLMVDAKHQRTGYGRAAMHLAMGWARDRGLPRFVTSVVPDEEGNALPFYERLGMARTGRIDDGEVELALTL